MSECNVRVTTTERRVRREIIPFIGVARRRDFGLQISRLAGWLAAWLAPLLVGGRSFVARQASVRHRSVVFAEPRPYASESFPKACWLSVSGTLSKPIFSWLDYVEVCPLAHRVGFPKKNHEPWIHFLSESSLPQSLPLNLVSRSQMSSSIKLTLSFRIHCDSSNVHTYARAHTHTDTNRMCSLRTHTCATFAAR